MIRVERIRKRFDAREVLRGISFSVPAGRTVVLLGPSGAGKSVLLKTMVGLLRPDDGEVWIDGVPLVGGPEPAAAEVRRRVGFVFQSSALFDSLTVAENILLGLDGDGLGGDPRRGRARVLECLRWVNLEPEIAAKHPAELSGGMQKRVAIARAIAGEQRYLLYDEPTAGLDPANAETVAELIRRLQGELGVTTVAVTHDLDLARHVADSVLLLDGGELVAETPVAALEALDHSMVRAFHRRRPRLEHVA